MQNDGTCLLVDQDDQDNYVELEPEDLNWRASGDLDVHAFAKDLLRDKRLAKKAKEGEELVLGWAKHFLKSFL